MSSPSLIESLTPYFIWFVIVVLTNYFFEFYSSKTKTTSKILTSVFFTVWLLLTVLLFIISLIHPLLNYPTDIIGQLIFNLVQVVIIGGIAFFIKYRKFKKKY